MSLEKYKEGLSQQYQGEVTGEVAQNALIRKFSTPWQKYLMGTALQLETETKARLRPIVAALGIDIVELEESREMGMVLAGLVKDLDWRETMQLLADALLPYVDKYQEIADNAPPEYKELAASMVQHERLLQQLYEQEANESGDSALDAIVKELIFPLPRPA